MTARRSARSSLRLPTRLLLSYVVVIGVGAVTAYVTVRLLLPPLFEHQMQMGNGSGGMMRGTGTTAATATHTALISALNVALWVAILASAAASGLVAAFVARRLLRPLSAVREATRRIARGDYQARVELPHEPELAALASDVNTLAAGLGETEVRRTRLLGDVAHEMRTPLAALDGYVEGLIDGVLRPDPQNLSAMADELRRLHRLSDDLAALSRAEEGRVDLHPVAADLGELAARTAARLRPQFEDAGIALAVHGDQPLPVRADVDRISQVLTNLLGNALIATPPGGRVEVVSERRGSRASVTVSDSGVGLADTDLERVFERFYRAPTATRRSPGSGVGLTISRGIARAHGGDLTARSGGPGRGASFMLTLPAPAPAPLAAEPARSPGAAVPAGTLASAQRSPAISSSAPEAARGSGRSDW